MYNGYIRKLRKDNGEFGLVTTAFIPANTVIHILVGESDIRTKYTIEQHGKHYIDDRIMYMNHSCGPTCSIQDKQVVSLKDLQPFTELTFDYATTESHILNSFQCFCGASTCRGKIYK